MEKEFEKNIIGVRLPQKMKEMLQKLEESGKYMDRSEIIRTAIRQLYDKEFPS